MKKTLKALALVLCLSLVLTGCSKKGFSSVITGYTSGDVTLGEYKGLTYTPVSTEVTDEDVENEIKALISANPIKTEITDRAVADGDIVNIDFTGYIDGEKFDGGESAGYELTIGSNSFIDGFEAGLIGAEIGSTVKLDLQFPNPYTNNTDLSGKDVTFDVTVNSITEQQYCSEADDAFIQSVTDYNTLAEYKEYVASELKAEKEEDAESQKKYDLVSKVIENATFNKDLTSKIEETTEELITNYNAMYQSYYGVDAATVFYYFYGMDESAFKEYMKEQAEMNVKYGMVSAAIVEAENITAASNEVSLLSDELLVNYGYSSADELYNYLKTTYGAEGKAVVEEQVKLNKAIDLVYTSAVAE